MDIYRGQTTRIFKFFRLTKTEVKLFRNVSRVLIKIGLKLEAITDSRNFKTEVKKSHGFWETNEEPVKKKRLYKEEEKNKSVKQKCKDSGSKWNYKRLNII